MRAAMVCGCEWCLDFASSISEEAGVGEDDLRELPTYSSSDRFSELEKLVLDYATGISRSPVDVPDELFDRLRSHLDEAQLVELTHMIALENYRARFNWAFGIEGQGFSEGAYCVRPEARAGLRSREIAFPRVPAVISGRIAARLLPCALDAGRCDPGPAPATTASPGQGGGAPGGRARLLDAGADARGRARRTWC